MTPDFEAPLARAFYERSVTDVAHDLLGCYLVRREGRRTSEKFLGGRIVEVEAYGGIGDPGSHADRAPNGRAKIMFGPAGIAYVYFTYGMHHCVNAVAGAEGDASAVLIRALEPAFDIGSMRQGAPTKLRDELVASGPGRLCRALRIDRELNGSDLTSGLLRVLPGADAPDEIHSGVRVGLSKDDQREWRFWLTSASVSRSPRLGSTRSRSSR